MRKVEVGLIAILVVSLCCNGYFGYLIYENSNSNNSEGWTKTFSFWWPPEEQNITSGNGILWMNFTFTKTAENLTIIVKVNDDDDRLYGCPASRGALLLAFDRNRNGRIDNGMDDVPYLLYSDNSTACSTGLDLPHFYSSFCVDPSRWHYCTFSNETGYTFYINLPLKDVEATGIVFAGYWDLDDVFWPIPPDGKWERFAGGMYVWVQFNYLG